MLGGSVACRFQIGENAWHVLDGGTDPHVHQVTPQSNTAAIQMAPNPVTDLFQEKAYQ